MLVTIILHLTITHGKHTAIVNTKLHIEQQHSQFNTVLLIAIYYIV